MKNLIIDQKEKILIISPHPDDEIIGCGGILVLYGKQCDVLLLTDGCLGNPRWSEARTRTVRRKEFEEVMKLCNVSNYFCLGIHDQELKENKNCYRGISLDIYDKIFVPNRNEVHVDHRAAFDQIKSDNVFRRRKCLYYQYEVWTPLTYPTHYLDLSKHIDAKIELLSCYHSQISEFDYVGAVKGLNLYRGATNCLEYAECFREGLK